MEGGALALDGRELSYTKVTICNAPISPSSGNQPMLEKF